MRFASRAEHGVDESQRGVHQTELDAFAEDHPNTPPEVLELYYGVEGEPTLRQQHQTGAGHPDNEEEDSDNDSDAVVDEETDQSHEPVKVPLSECPFDDAGLLLFQSALKIVSEEGILPAGYNVCEDEWDGVAYPVVEKITVGSRKKVPIVLPLEDWLPRARRWAQALDVMNRILLDL